MRLLMFVLTAFLAGNRILSEGAAAAGGGVIPAGRFALVFIDTDALACSPCLVSFEALCRAVPPAVQEERMLGVLTYHEGTAADSRRARIARTRWTGYSRAAGIRFPAIVDAPRAFDGWNLNRSSVILFDLAGGELKRYGPALTPRDIEEIAAFLLDRLSPIMEPCP